MTDARQEFDLPEGPQGPEELLSAYLFDELDAADRLALEQRLENEPALAERLEELRETLSLLRQASMDAGPGELSHARRDALRAEAREVAGVTADPQMGAILAFPWLRAAAAVLMVSAGVLIYTQPGLVMPESSLETRTASRGSSYDDSAATGAADSSWSEDASLEALGYAPSPAPSAENESRGGGVKGRADGGELAELQEQARELANILPEQTLDDRSRGFRDQLDAQVKSIQESGKLTVEEREALTALGYLGSADSVPPTEAPSGGIAGRTGGEAGFIAKADTGEAKDGAKVEFNRDAWSKIADRESARPSAPSAPAAPGTPSTPGAPAAKKQPEEEAERMAFRRQSETSSNGVNPSIDPVELGDVALLQGLSGGAAFGNFGEDTANFFQPIELGLLTTGFVDNFGFDADSAAELDFETQLGRYAYVQDGYGRPFHQDQILYHLRPVHENETPQDMFFRYYGDNAFVAAAQDNMSTFAVDVDTASYPLARNYLSNNMLPPRASVRTEEVVNYFDQGIAAPQDDLFTVQLDAAETPYGAEEGNVLLRVGVKAKEVSREERLPMNLVFVVDKSGSMRKQDRLNLVKRSLELLLDQVRDDDRIGVVSFDTNGHIVQESVAGRDRWQVREALRGLNADGSTNAAEGLFLGYEMLDRNFIEGGINRVVLASDGVANTGETDQQRILEQVADFTARQVDLTTIGVGMGNHNDVFLEQLADKGNGSCHYVDGFDEAKRVFLDEFAGTMQTIARDVKIQVEFDEQRVTKWRQIGYENRALTHEQFRDDSVDAGEVGAGHEIVALYELELPPESVEPSTGIPAPLATVRMRWMPDAAFVASLSSVQKAGVPDVEGLELQVVERSWQLDPNQVQTDWTESPSRYRLAAVSAQYAEYLRRSYHVRGDSYDQLEADASQLVVELGEDQQVRELRDLIRRTRDLVRYREPGSELWKLIEESRRITMLQQELRGKKERNAETEDLLVELLKQNEKLEERIREHLEESGK